MIANLTIPGRKGNYAESVKIILPLAVWGGLSISSPKWSLSPYNPNYLRQNSVDMAGVVGIITLTLFPLLTGGGHGRTQRQQDQSSSRTWGPQPQSQAGSRPTLPAQRVFRPARPGVGQVRDAAPGTDRGPVSYPGSPDIRILSGRFLPGQGCLSGPRPAGTTAKTPRAQTRSQAHRPGAEVHRPEACGRQQPAGVSSCGDDTGAVGTIGTSSQYRAGFGPKGKKGATGRAVLGPGTPGDSWTSQYEDLRRTRLDGDWSVNGSWGLALLMRQGLVAWMCTCPPELHDTPVTSKPIPPPAELSKSVSGQLVTVLTNMVLAARQEVLS